MSAFDWSQNLAIGARQARDVLAALLAGIAFAASGTAIAQQANTIKSMTVSKGTSGNTIVKFDLSAPPANPPAGFAIASPPRIALDFLDTPNGLGATQRTVDDPALRSLNVIQAATARASCSTSTGRRPSRPASRAIRCWSRCIDQGGQLEATTQTVQRFAEAQPGDIDHSLRDIDFRRGVNGEGRIVVDLSDNSTGIDIRQQGKSLIVDFVKTSLPRNLERRLDVGDFGTPVVSVDTFKQGANTRMVIEPKGLWEHSAYQTDNRFILEVKPIQEDPNKLTQGTRQGYKGEKLSLNFQNVEVRAVLQVIADFTGLNIITSDTVTGSLTLRLKDIPVGPGARHHHADQGPRHAQERQCRAHRAARGARAQGEASSSRTRRQISELEPLISESFQLNYIKANDLLNLIATNRQQQFGAGAGQTATTGGQGSILSKRGVALVDPRTNILFVQDTASRARGGPQDHPPDRHPDPPGDDRGADRHRQRQLQPSARRALRRSRRASRSTTSATRAAGRQPQHAAGRQLYRRIGDDSRDLHARDADADAVRARVGHRVGGLFRLAAAQREPAGHQPGRTSSR